MNLSTNSKPVTHATEIAIARKVAACYADPGNQDAAYCIVLHWFAQIRADRSFQRRITTGQWVFLVSLAGLRRLVARGLGACYLDGKPHTLWTNLVTAINMQAAS